MGTVAYHLYEITSGLAAISETASLDAQVLIGHVLEKTRAWVIAHPEIDLTQAQAQALGSAFQRLETGEPLPYVIGHWEFYGLDFIVNPAVLIPRPETELLVDQALSWLRAHPQSRRVADVGCGSGCIAITLAALMSDLQLLATDISPSALDVAGQNALRHGVSQSITFAQADLILFQDTVTDAGFSSFDVICANLPYIPTQRLKSLAVFGKEPRLALDGGEDGLELIRQLIAQAPAILAAEGLILLEIDETQGETVLSLSRAAFPEARSSILPDLAGKDRLLKIERKAR